MRGYWMEKLTSVDGLKMNEFQFEVYNIDL